MGRWRSSRQHRGGFRIRSDAVPRPFAIYKHPHANGFVLIHLPSQAKIIELEMQNACKDAAEKFAALDLNWWACLPGSPVIGGGRTGEDRVLSARIRALKSLGAGFLPAPIL